ncbi:head decoration protein [Microvirga sp. Mcv34]|uniref:head decoration protein n=1 Tax=Microvirga sp. Mcv34 TaxID=2926016 RepID=UPI0021C8A872|nr:head decoration protein [Microvirga sp. Mcv34]
MPTELDLPIATEYAGFLVSEAHGYRSRDVLTIPAGAGKFEAGHVFGQAANGQAAAYNNAGTGGAETAKAILLQAVDASTKAVKATFIVRDAEVQRSMLRFSGSPADADKLAAYADLAGSHIVMR